MCATQVSILGLLANDPATEPGGLPWTPCNLMLIKQVIFRDNKNFWYLVVPQNNFESLSKCPLVQGLIRPPSPEVVVGGGGLFHDYSSIFSFINIHEYAKEIILYMNIG